MIVYEKCTKMQINVHRLARQLNIPNMILCKTHFLIILSHVRGIYSVSGLNLFSRNDQIRVDQVYEVSAF